MPFLALTIHLRLHIVLQGSLKPQRAGLLQRLQEEEAEEEEKKKNLEEAREKEEVRGTEDESHVEL